MTEVEYMQKLGKLDSQLFQELLASFNENDDIKIPSSKKRNPTEIFGRNSTCIFCKSFECIVDSEEGRYVCTKCGRDNGEILDSQEWRSSNDDMKKNGDQSRVGMPINESFPKASLSCIIGGYGNQPFRRYQKYNTMDYDERSLLKNFQFIDTSTDDLCSEAVKEHAKNVYKKISEDENKRGKKKQSIMAACVCFASQGRDIDVDKEKLSENFLVTKKKFTKGCNFYKEQLFEKEPEYYAKMKPISAEDEIKKICHMISMEELYTNITCYVAYMAMELGVVIKNTPISIAIGSIFLVSNLYEIPIDRKDLSSKCDISDVTINKLVTLLTSYRNYLIPTEKLYQRFMELRN